MGEGLGAGDAGVGEGVGVGDGLDVADGVGLPEADAELVAAGLTVALGVGLAVGVGDMQSPLRRGQRDGHDRAVEDDHQLCQGDHRQRPPPSAGPA